MKTISPPPSPPSAMTTGAPAAAGRPRLRERGLAHHLDMAVIGEVCRNVGLPGYRAVLASFLDDESGNQAALLAALGRADHGELAKRAHTLNGAAASLGLRAIRAAAMRLETAGPTLDAEGRTAAAAELRTLLAAARRLLQRLGFA